MLRIGVLLSALTALSFFSIPVYAQMTISEVGPAASYTPNSLPGGGIAQGSYFYIKGTNLGPATGTLFTGPANYQMGVDLAGTRVRVQVGSTTVDAFPYYASAAQVNALLPSSTPVGAGTVTVLFNGQQVVSPITITRAAYGIFTLNSAGSGPAVMQDAAGQLVTFTAALNPGERGVIYGTGLGPVTFPDNQPAQAQRLQDGVSVIIGGKTATVEYAGRTPGLSGLDQINFIVPTGVTGCNVPVVVRIANLPSNFATMPIAASGRTCSDAGGLSAQDLAAAQASGATMGFVNLSRIFTKTTAGGLTIDAQADTVSGGFYRYDFNSLIRSQQASPGITPGSCTVSLYRGDVPPTDPTQPRVLDAGAKLSLNPGGKDVPKGTGGLYSLFSTSSNLPLPGGITIPGLSTGAILGPGNYTVSGTGGADIGPFSASITLPSVLTWSNPVTTVSRSQDLTVRWTGGSSSDIAMIIGGSSDAANNSGSFVCWENVSAGSFTVPSYILNAIPSSAVIQGTPTGRLQVGSTSTGTRFTATGLTYGVISHASVTSNSVTFQ